MQRSFVISAALLCLPPRALAADQALLLDGGHLDGLADFVELGSLDPGTSFTVEGWMRFDGVNIDIDPELELVAHDTLMEVIDPITGFNSFYLGYTAAWSAVVEDTNGAENTNCTEAITVLCVSGAVAVGDVHHLAASVDPTEVRLYLDGVEIGSTPALATVSGFATDLWRIAIDDVAANNDGLDGVVDEVRVWSVARDEADIACTLDYTLTGDEPGLHALYSFDAGTPLATPDATGTHADAVLMGNPAYILSPFGLVTSAGGDIPCFDFDGDGFSADEGDCDDEDPTLSPGEPEVVYDGADNDCDPSTPDDDLDGDLYLAISDCDDLDPAVSPGAVEVPYDGIDNDCEAFTRDDDLDQDGFELVDDCDDADAAISPAATEVVYDGLDNDCDAATPDDDLDGDGSLGVDDCDDGDPAVAPGLAELCDGLDQDCDELVDEGCPPETGTDPTDPTGTDPTGTDPTGTDPTGTDPTGTDPTDPGTPDDRGAPSGDTGGEAPPLVPGACGCATSTGPAAGWLIAPLAWFALGRRRRGALGSTPRSVARGTLRP